MRLLSVLLLGLFITACQAFDSRPLAPRLPDAGSTLTLHQDLDVPTGMARVHIQDGGVIAERDVDKFRPYCQFQTFDLSTPARPLRILADRFMIERAWLTRHSVSLEQARFVSSTFDPFDGGPSQVSLATEMQLVSARQPGVYRLSCRYWADPYQAYLKLAQVRTTLGTVATLD